jgi:hypothetical protein
MIRCREIGEADITHAVALLMRGFPNRSRKFWLMVFGQLTARMSPVGVPKYGYLLESDGVAVGVLLTICSTVSTGDVTATRCNLSSWYVEPRFRAYGTLLTSRALQHKAATYLNVSPAPHTRPIIEAMGFSRYSDGVFIAVPLLSRLFSGSVEVKVFGLHGLPDTGDQKLLLEHAAHGCISLWCTTSEYAGPFVFRFRRLKGVIPCAQLIYCRNVADFVRFARPIGSFLGLRGIPFVMIDASGPIIGLVGAYFHNKMPKYFRGPQRPHIGDLAYTECALFGA